MKNDLTAVLFGALLGYGLFKLSANILELEQTWSNLDVFVFMLLCNTVLAIFTGRTL